MTRTLSLLLLLTLAACGGVGGDAAHDGGPTDDLPIISCGRTCIADEDCGSPDYLCAYAIADGCAARGHCAPIPMPTCASFTELCGCNGQPVRAGGCFYETGYAGGPTSGAAFCSTDGGSGD